MYSYWWKSSHGPCWLDFSLGAGQGGNDKENLYKTYTKLIQRKLILVILYIPNQFLKNYGLEIINFHDIILIAEPKVEAIDRKAGEAIKDFKEVVFPDDYNPAGKPAAKRKV